MRVVVLRFRHSFLMQFSSRHKSSSQVTHKRTFAQQKTTIKDPNANSQKVPRIDTIEPKSSFSTSRWATESPALTTLASSPFLETPQSSSYPSEVFRHRHSRPAGRMNTSRSLNKYREGYRYLEGPTHDHAFITRKYRTSLLPLKPVHELTPKSSLANFAMVATTCLPTYSFTEALILDEITRKPRSIWRATVTVHLEAPIIGVGDHPEKKQAEKLSALSAVYQLHGLGLIDNPGGPHHELTLSDGSIVTYERARSFMDYYCRRYAFRKPEVKFQEIRKPGSGWEAIMDVGGCRIGLGSAGSKKGAQIACYLDVTKYLEKCDPELWKAFIDAAKSGADLGLAPKVFFQMSGRLNNEIRDLCADIEKSHLHRNRPITSVKSDSSPQALPLLSYLFPQQSDMKSIAEKSRQLLERRRNYLTNPEMERMRKTRSALPVYTRADDILSHINDNEVTICMAATGSGKTTQIPQLILDACIDRGEGAYCNIVCTQPRRLAAISVADRVAKERGEMVGKSIGYQVRFEAKLPQRNGSITFCTTGIFLKRLQSSFSDAVHPGSKSLDDVTHIIVDEVHERDVDTDLLLVVLKRLLADRKARKKPLKIILMSATVDPTLFQKYFLDDFNQPAKVIEVPGRSFPVTKHFMEDFIPQIVKGPTSWILEQDSVIKYLNRELGPAPIASLGKFYSPKTIPGSENLKEDLELPYPLISATISFVLQSSDQGHVLVFLPGWDDILGVQRCLQSPQGSLGLEFNDISKFSIHILHSTIPLAEQQIIFEPPSQGVRRIILATNIAETSVTIPDVVYVVDTAKIKEQRYDPERHMSSLVSVWISSSNLNQRAGRAGRHRAGEYFGILGRARAETLHPHQTVEMKRVDLSNVVMHVKALSFPGMGIEDVLAATIEPPLPERVAAAIKDLQMVGALDANKGLTSLGRVILQLPVEAQVGRLVLYGSFFRCLDQALTLAAILTNREPFMSPMYLKAEAAAKKLFWTPQGFRSDVLAALQAFNAWWTLQSRGEYISANRFCIDNFLAKPTLLMIQKIRTHILQSLYHAGVIDVSAGGLVDGRDRQSVPQELNVNGDSLPLLAALISMASQPKFAIRVGEKTYRTSQDKITFIHPSSVNHRKKEFADQAISSSGEKQLFAYTEKRRNISAGSSDAQTFLMTTTRIDPLAYMLFGAYKLEVVERGLECDSWLPIVGNLDALDDVQRLKTLMDGCILRVFEGITTGKRYQSRSLAMSQEEVSESEDEHEGRDYSISEGEIRELDLMTRDIVRILNRYSEERAAIHSRSSWPTTPIDSPSSRSARLPGLLSGYSTPSFEGSTYNSRAGTPSKLSQRF